MMWCTNINAEYIYKNYRQNPTDLYEYVHGLGDGMGWSITLQEKIGPKFFCQPRDLALGPDDYIEILEIEAERIIAKLGRDEVDEINLGLILAMAHQRKFPC